MLDFLKQKFLKMSPFRVIILIFLALILFGALLLSLPFASKSEGAESFFNALFTSTSATCVTGVLISDIYENWTIFGQIVILILIQLGGLGFMTIATLFSVILKRRITLRERIIMSESLNQIDFKGIVRLALHVLIGTFIIEAVGAIVLSTQFIPRYGIWGGIYRGVFHSISAFCNAGMDILGDNMPYSSLTSYVKNPVVNFTVMILIIVGGLGFGVWEDILNKKKYKKLSVHSKMVIITSVILILFGSFSFFMIEYNNPNTLGNFSFIEKMQASLFHSVSIRTAGFNTFPVVKMEDASKLITIILMFIGGSSGSTAGGIKTTTVGVLIYAVYANLKGLADVNIHGRRIRKQTIIRALSIFLIGLLTVLISTFLILILENHQFLDVLFETTSVFSTVGLTTELTSTLTIASKIIYMILMFFGRVGVLTIALALMVSKKDKSSIRYPEGKISVG